VWCCGPACCEVECGWREGSGEDGDDIKLDQEGKRAVWTE
jgi:hypothetical protein